MLGEKCIAIFATQNQFCIASIVLHRKLRYDTKPFGLDFGGCVAKLGKVMWC